MDANDTARAIADPTQDLGGRFMLSGRTYARGNELGFTGLDFYFCGRAGVLGRVDAEVVVDELGFFAPDNVRSNWELGCSVMEPTEAADHFMACGHEWGRARLADDLDAARLAELVRKVADAADDQPALFTAWAQLDWPDDDAAAALHAIHLLRELRGGAHVRAIRESGLDPHTAVMVRAGAGGAEFFGWAAPHPDPEGSRDTWEAAEEATNRYVAATLACLDEAELTELADLCSAAVPT